MPSRAIVMGRDNEIGAKKLSLINVSLCNEFVSRLLEVCFIRISAGEMDMLFSFFILLGIYLLLAG